MTTNRVVVGLAVLAVLAMLTACTPAPVPAPAPAPTPDSGEAEERTLLDLFGATFGKPMPEDEFYRFNREEPGCEPWGQREYLVRGTGYDLLQLWTTPVSRRVAEMRTNRWVRPGESADRVMADTVRKVTELSGRDGEPDGEDGGICLFRFGGGNTIQVVNWGDFITVHASCPRLDAACTREMKALVAEEAERFREALDVLAPIRSGYPKEMFGVAFGEPCRGALSGPEPAEHGAWEYRIAPPGSFLGCTSFTAIATAESKTVFAVSATWPCKGEGERCDMRWRLARLVELVTETPKRFNEWGDVRIDLMEDRKPGEFRVKFIRTSLWLQHLLELGEEPQW